MGFSRQEYASGLTFSSPDLPDSGIKLVSPALAGGFFTAEPPGKPQSIRLKMPELPWDYMEDGRHGSF